MRQNCYFLRKWKAIYVVKVEAVVNDQFELLPNRQRHWFLREKNYRYRTDTDSADFSDSNNSTDSTDFYWFKPILPILTDSTDSFCYKGRTPQYQKIQGFLNFFGIAECCYVFKIRAGGCYTFLEKCCYVFS